MLCFANADLVLCFAKHDFVTTTMPQARISSMFLLFATVKPRHKHNNQPEGQGKTKGLSLLYFHCASASPPTQTHFLSPAKILVDCCFSFFMRNSRRLPHRWAREKNERLQEIDNQISIRAPCGLITRQDGRTRSLLIRNPG